MSKVVGCGSAFQGPLLELVFHESLIHSSADCYQDATPAQATIERGIGRCNGSCMAHYGLEDADPVDSQSLHSGRKLNTNGWSGLIASTLTDCMRVA